MIWFLIAVAAVVLLFVLWVFRDSKRPKCPDCNGTGECGHRNILFELLPACRRCGGTGLMALMLLAAVSAEAAKKPEPLTYKIGGRRYVITLPNTQLWSVSEVARAVQWHKAGELTIDGQAIRQVRVRGVDGDRTNRNYLVIVMRTGKRLSPPPKYFVRPDPWGQAAPPIPPAALAYRAPAKSSKSMAPPATLTLRWSDVPGAVPGGWGTGPSMMPDGGTKFWTIYSSTNLRDWRVRDVVEATSYTVPMVGAAEFFRVHWRDDGSPSWVWP